MCFASAESDSWSDFQGVHVCSLVLSHMLQWKWDFFQNSSQHFNRSFHFFPCAREGAIQRSLWTQSQCQSVEVTYGAVTRWCHTFFFFCSSSMQIISCSCSRITCLNSEVCFLSFPLVVVFFFFFCKGCVSIWIWGWSPCVHMLMLPPHLPGLVCIFCFRFSGERESFLSPPRFLLRSRKRKQNGLRNHSRETRARFYWINFGWSEVIDFTLTESRFWGLPLKAPWIPRILSQSWGDIDHRMLLWMLTAVKVYGGLKLPKSKVDE